LAKFTGKGAKAQIRTTASPEAWLDIAQVREIGGMDITSEEVDVTTLDDNVSGAPTDYKDSIPGFKDPGEMPITLIFDPTIASHFTDPNSVYNKFDTGETILLRVTIPSSPVRYIRANGYFRDWTTPTFNATDPVESTFTFRNKQKPVITTT
jgi:hypothetical protein